ncbi:hypothetical protein GCM10023156_59400 [Novipirellula rosea]|uniref:Uncharacterized protein n=1 Tax=Novipirellula rosea TaxID=1031540 RepID=A0ABP8NNW0_9BACT
MWVTVGLGAGSLARSTTKNVANGEEGICDSVSSVCSCSNKTAQLDRAVVALVGDGDWWLGRDLDLSNQYGGIFSKIHYGRVG